MLILCVCVCVCVSSNTQSFCCHYLLRGTIDCLWMKMGRICFVLFLIRWTFSEKSENYVIFWHDADASTYTEYISFDLFIVVHIQFLELFSKQTKQEQQKWTTTIANHVPFSFWCIQTLYVRIHVELCSWNYARIVFGFRLCVVWKDAGEKLGKLQTLRARKSKKSTAAHEQR